MLNLITIKSIHLIALSLLLLSATAHADDSVPSEHSRVFAITPQQLRIDAILEQSKDSLIIGALAKNPATLKSSLYKLINDASRPDHKFIVGCVAENNKCTEELLTSIYIGSGEGRVFNRQYEYQLLRNPNTPKWLIKKIFEVNKEFGPPPSKIRTPEQFTDPDMILVANPSVYTGDALRKLIKSALADEHVSEDSPPSHYGVTLVRPLYMAMLDNPNLPSDMVSLYVRAGIKNALAHPNADGDAMRSVKLKDLTCLSCSVRNPNPIYTMLFERELSRGKKTGEYDNQFVRYAEIGLATNPSSSADCLIGIASRNEDHLDLLLLTNPSIPSEALDIILKHLNRRQPSSGLFSESGNKADSSDVRIKSSTKEITPRKIVSQVEITGILKKAMPKGLLIEKYKISSASALINVEGFSAGLRKSGSTQTKRALVALVTQNLDENSKQKETLKNQVNEGDAMKLDADRLVDLKNEFVKEITAEVKDRLPPKRFWKSIGKSGMIAGTGNFIQSDGDQIILLLGEDNLVSVEASSLCDSDREYIKISSQRK